MTRTAEIAIVLDGPPGAESGRFVEVEVDGRGVALGRWEKVDAFSGPSDKVELVPRWELRFTLADAAAALAGAPGSAYLDHVYNGPAVRIEPEGRPGLLGYEEHLTGAFAVLYRDERCAILDNGENPRGRWLVTLLDRLVRP